MAFGPAIITLLGAAFFLHALVYVIRGSTLPHRMGSTASCGRCGYAYSGLARCPECGSDVAEAGVLTPRLAFRLRGGLLSVAIALLVVVTIGSVPVTRMASALASSLGYRRKTLDYTLIPTPSAATVAPNSYEVEFVGDLVSRTGPAISGTLNVAVSRTPVMHGVGNWLAASGLPRAEIDGGSGIVRLYDGRGNKVRTEEAFDEDVSAALFRLAGLDASNAEVRTSCQDLALYVHAELKDPWGAFSSPVLASNFSGPAGTLQPGGGSQGGPALPFTIPGLGYENTVAVIVVTGAALLYVIALAAIVRRRRRLVHG